MSEYVCPATMCPYMGVEDGSPFTGEVETECETSCGWYDADGDFCIAGNDLAAQFGDEIDDIGSLGKVPPCQWEDRCLWEQQVGEELPCPPRLAMMVGKSPTDALF